MKSLKKDIKKEFFKDGTREGELAPIIYKDGKRLIPTNKGYVVDNRNKR